jgi:two-component system sensor histidine kinase SenX3
VLILVAFASAAIGALIATFTMARQAAARGRASSAAIANEIERTAVLARGRDLLTAAVAAFDAGVVVVDRQGDELMRNVAMSRLTGSRRVQVLVDEACEGMLRGALAGESSSRELPLFGPPHLVLSIRAAPLTKDDRVVGAVAWVIDVTQPHRVDDVRKDFVANVSHELRTPIGALGVLAETMVDETDIEVTRKFAARIVREADRLARLVDDLLDLSQLEADAPVERELVDVDVIVRAAIEQVASAAEAATIGVRAGMIAPDLRVTADRRQLVSAVYNLLDNAVKYSEPGSTVDVTVDRLERSVAIMVRDRGIGIPSRDLERIFERFYRVDRARSRETGGTGLGLSIVRHVARAHGGDVSVISHEGEGSAFTLSLPLAESSNVINHEVG